MRFRSVRSVSVPSAPLWLVLALGCSPAAGERDHGGSGPSSGGTGGSGGSTGVTSGGSSSGGSGATTGGSSAGGAANGGSGASVSAGGSDTGGNGSGATGGSSNPGSGMIGELNDCEVPAGGAQSNPLGLTPGVWMDITPTDISGTFGANSIDVDPSNPLTIYASLDQRGIWKSTNGGGDWTRLGNPDDTGENATGYIDSPLRVAVDPCDSMHLYATQGVRGETQGFWVSNDGGETWVRPQGFIDILPETTFDVTTLAVNPTSFDHVLVGAHSPWPGQDGAGIIESTDGGATFHKRSPDANGFQAGSIGIAFVYAPEQELGDSFTWVVNGDGAGTWRTIDQGETWEHVSDLSGTHGGSDLYISSAGDLYFGGYQYPYRSTDLGATWSHVSDGLPYSYYLGMVGDGTQMYTLPSFPDGGANYNQPYYTSLETDGTTWTAYQGGAQKFKDGPYRARFDPVNRIIYSANWVAGVWALRVIDP